ncbi:hypothetical protein [Robertkochia sediminum]|uniref:hypothetical protein n=1 Tax=Robertkochia sediminum TaxID=2785326 RepID=UPI0019333560|nr:hypothetical protein [Robertkochia sediminum]MBL7473198.1 hypothetical protein [Robertkochia sediminum]
MKTICYILLTAYSLNCTFGQSTPIRNKAEIITEINGDLDLDGTDEKVIVYETHEKTPLGNVREIQILKNTSGVWTTWRRSRSAILKSEEGRMMGDPFHSIEIENGILKIYFSGGSNWKWSYTDSYRFQNNQFELVEFTHVYFKLCEYLESTDFNLTSGKLVSKKEYERCINEEPETFRYENETFFKRGMVITLEDRYEKEIKIVTPKYGREIYLASGN